MQTNLIKFNTYKLERGGLLVPMYDQFNARVGDQGTPLVIQWTQGTTDTPVHLHWSSWQVSGKTRRWHGLQDVCRCLWC